jgi:hypothetical protein
MSAAGQSSRSIAVELALLFLRELEPLVAEDPQRLVSTEAILSFAAVRRGDPITWQHWRRILEKYEKSDLIGHMLGEPLHLDHDDGGSAADRLIGLVPRVIVKCCGLAGHDQAASLGSFSVD